MPFSQFPVGDAQGNIVQRTVAVCRQCGCSDVQACPGGCYWVEPDLCRCCAPKLDLEALDDLHVRILDLDGDAMCYACEDEWPCGWIQLVAHERALARMKAGWRLERESLELLCDAFNDAARGILHIGRSDQELVARGMEIFERVRKRYPSPAQEADHA
jgi:hypothetical protein